MSMSNEKQNSLDPPELPDPELLPSVMAVVSTDPSLKVLVTVLSQPKPPPNQYPDSFSFKNVQERNGTHNVLPPVT